MEKFESKFSPSNYGQIVGQPILFNLGIAIGLGETLNLNLLNSA